MKNFYKYLLTRCLLLIFLIITVLPSFGQDTPGVTIITHGFDPGGSVVRTITDKLWMEYYAEAILNRLGGGSIYTNHSGTGRWEFNKTIGTTGTHTVLIYNWSGESKHFNDGWLESSADALYALLMNPPNGMTQSQFWDNSYKKHFIGHSRGAPLLIQLFHRLNKWNSNVNIHQYTSLDPHPAKNFMKDVNLPYINSVGGVLPNYEINLPPNVLKADNYYRKSGIYEADLGFDGVYVNGAQNVKLNNSLIDAPTCQIIDIGGAHTKVPMWYYGTIATSANKYPPNKCNFRTFYYDYYDQNSYFDQSDFSNNSRQVAGYNHSIFINDDLSSASTNPSVIPSPDRLFNGDFDLIDFTILGVPRIPGWKGNRGNRKSALFLKVDQYMARLQGKSGSMTHTVLHFPTEAKKLRVNAKAGNTTGKNQFKVIFENYDQSKFKDKNSYVKTLTNSFSDYTFEIPTELQGKTGSVTIMNVSGTSLLKEISLRNANDNKLRQSNTLADTLDLAATYFDFPVDYDVNPNPLYKGLKPTSFKATITNTMPTFWAGTLKMYWRKVSDDDKGMPLTSQLVNLAPGASVTLDRGTDFIISDPDVYILGIYANNDEVPIDEYFFYVEDQHEPEVSTPTVSVSPGESTHTFGSVVVGSTDSQTFTIQNTSNAAVSISGVTISGAGFSSGGGYCCGTLAPNQSYTVKVNASPANATVYTGQLQINGNFEGAPIVIQLTAQGVYNTPPVTGCLTASVSAINIQSGNTDALKQQYFGLNNTSLTGSVNVTNVSFTGADASYFSYDGNMFNLPSSIPPGQTNGFLVKFNNPQNINRTYTANLVFTTSNPSCPSLTIPVSATHTPSTLTWISPVTDETIVATESPIEAIHLKWQGTLPIDGGSVDIQYTIDGGQTWTPIYNPQSCTTGHNNTGINVTSMNLPYETFSGHDIQFRIKPCYDNVTPWKYSGIAHITSPDQNTLEVLQPNGYEIYNGGQTAKIKWANYIGYNAVNIAYSYANTYGNIVKVPIASNVSGQATEYNWTVPSDFYNESVRIIISAANVADSSDNYFYIQPTPNPPIVVSNISVKPEGCKTNPEGLINFNANIVPASLSIRRTDSVGIFTPSNYFIGAGLNQITDLKAGEYEVFVKDNNFRRASFMVTVPKYQEFTYNIQVLNDTCSGNKGKIAIILGNTFQYFGLGGSLYNIKFEKDGAEVYSGQNTSLLNQTTGFYTVTIKDAQQCGVTENVYIDSSPGAYYSVASTITPTSCTESTGSIVLNTGTATNPIFLWSTGATTSSITNLNAGTYTVDISDGSGCVQRKSFDVVEQGGWSETPTSYISTRDTKADGNKVYSNDMVTHQINIVDVTNNTHDYIKILKHYSTTDYVDAYRIDVQNGFLYMVYNDFKPGPNGGEETHFLKINPVSKQVLSRVIVPNSSYDYFKITFIAGKLYCLRSTNNSLDIVDFTANSFISKPITGQCEDFSLGDNNKLYLSGFDTSNNPKVFVYDIASASFNPNTYYIPYIARKILVNGNYAYLTGSSTNGTYIQRFNISTLTFLDNVLINSSAPFPSDVTLGGSQNLFISYFQTGSNYIDVVNIDSFQKTERISTQGYFNNLVFSNSANALYGSTRINNNNFLTKLISNKFDFTLTKIDATCGQNNGSITPTMPNDGQAYTYLWSNGATTKDISALSADNYTITVSQVGGCSVKRTIAINQNGTVVASPTGIPSGRCEAGSVTLGATGCSGTYKWYNLQSKEFLLGTGSSFTYNYTISSYAWVTCTVGACESEAIGVLATINPLPAAPTVSSTNINSGQTATLTATGCSGTVTWYAAASGGTALGSGSSFITPVLTANATYYASCFASGCTSSTRSSGTVTVNSNPIILGTLASANYCMGNYISVPFTTTLPAGTTYTAVLKKGGVNMISTNGTASPISLFIPYNQSITYGSDYTLQVTAGANSSGSSPNLTIGTITNAYVSDADNLPFNYTDYLCSGKTKVYYATAKDNWGNVITAGLSYQWKKDGVDIAGATASILSVSSPGIYTFTVTQATCTRTASTINLVTGSSGFVRSYGDEVACAGTTKRIDAVYYSNTATYQWYKDGSLISGATARHYDATQSGLYKVMFTDGSCSTTSTERRITFGSGLLANITVGNGDSTLCGGNYKTLYANYETNLNPSQYTYQWKKDGVNITGATNFNYSTNQPGVYSVTYSQGSCTSTSQGKTLVSSSKAQTPVISAGDVTICGGSVILDQRIGEDYKNLYGYWYKDGIIIPPGNTSYLYTATASGNYKMVYGSGSCAAESNTVTVNIGSTFTPKIYIPPYYNKTTLCGTGDYLYMYFDNRNLSGGTYTYQWKKDGVNITGGTLSGLYVNSPGVYSLTLTNGSCSGTSNSITVTAGSNPMITATDNNLCNSNKAVKLEIKGAASFFYNTSVVWKRNGTVIPNETSGFIYVNQSGTYTATYNQNGCSGTTPAFVFNAEAPPAPTVAPVIISSGQTATLTATGCAGTVTWYAAASGGTTLGTGSSFITPVLTTTTNYYADCTVSSCTSSTRGSGTVTVSACPPTVTHSGNISSGTYKAAQTISSTATVSGSVNYQTGKSVTLSPGFKTTPGAVFEAKVQGCP